MSKKVTRKKEKHIPQRKRGNYRAPSTEKRKKKEEDEAAVEDKA